MGACRRRVLARAHRIHHVVDDIEYLQHRVYEGGIDLTLSLTQCIEDVFRAMADVYERRDVQEPGPALHRVKTAKDRIQQILIGRPLFELDQLLAQRIQYLSGLDQKVLEYFVVYIYCHMRCPE